MAVKDALPSSEAEPAPYTVLTFPGQGSQRVGMGLRLVESSQTARDIYAEADRLVGFPMSEVSFRGPADILNQTKFSQPAIFVESYCNFRLLREAGQLEGQPIVTAAGHSLGEYAALVATGSLTFADALLVVKQRGILMQNAGDTNKGGLVALAGQTDEDSLKLRELGLTEALFNAPDQITFGGSDQSIEAASLHFGRRLKRLPVSCAPHTQLMEPAVEPFSRVLERVEIRNASIPVISNSTAQPAVQSRDIKQGLLDQLTKPVLWTQTLEFLDKTGIHRSINVGDRDTTAKWHHKTIGGTIAGTLLTLGGAVGAYVWHKHHFHQS